MLLINTPPKMPDPRPNPDEWTEAGMTADESLGRPAKRSPSEGINEMEARIQLLKIRRNIANARHQAAPYLSGERRHFAFECLKLDRELKEAEQRLTEYKTQLEGQN